MNFKTLRSMDELRHQLSEVTSDRNASASLPPACYSDGSVFDRETEAIFYHSWIGLGRADRWKLPGDYSAMDIAGVPVIIIRTKAGQLKGFANSCRHRGSQILKGDGNCRAIRCPFHCWSYDLDGNLVYAPKMENAIDFDPKEFGLVEFRVRQCDGFAFLCLDDEVGELEQWLMDFSEMHAPWALDQLVSTRLREFEVNCNWKAFIEVFNEYYHLPYVHPDTLGNFYPEPEDADQVSGNYTTQFGITDGNAALLAETQDQALAPAKQISGREKNGIRYTWIYPNLTFATSPDSLWMYQAYPITPDRSWIVQTICFPAHTVKRAEFESRVKYYYDRYDAALAEDIPFLEQQQAGLSSKFARPGRFSSLEPSVANFAHWYAGRLASALES
ncbi:MAG: aromatic ring-hydroxylating dioxygenase subunit alpha [Gammaproteobacteria bacterium]|nr:aromatic ring-hydroxylating dioxygenase subunit alpha [Gammaproteobacteria bacterium]